MQSLDIVLPGCFDLRRVTVRGGSSKVEWYLGKKEYKW